MEIDDLVHRVTTVAEEVTGAAARLGLADPGGRAFGVDGPGRLGELAGALHRTRPGALAARVWWGAGQGARLTDLAGALGRAADSYREAEQGAHHRHRAVS